MLDDIPNPRDKTGGPCPVYVTQEVVAGSWLLPELAQMMGAGTVKDQKKKKGRRAARVNLIRPVCFVSFVEEEARMKNWTHSLLTLALPASAWYSINEVVFNLPFIICQEWRPEFSCLLLPVESRLQE